MAAGPNDSGGAAAPDGGLPGFGEAHRRLLGDESIQFDLRRPDGSDATGAPPIQPTGSPAPAAAPPPTVHHDPAPPTPPHGAPDPFFGGADAAASGATAQVIFWVVLGLAVAALLFFIIARLAGWRRAPRDKAVAERNRPHAQAWQMAPQPARTLLDQADAIAAAGRYDEAAHLLLHGSIEEIDARRPAAIGKALTSRDIARLPGLPPGPAAGFAAIVGAVERSLFANRPLGADDWSRCRADYQHFAFAENRAR